MSVELKTYLGDSVYAEYEPCSGCFRLTTENGLPTDPSNVIVLEPEVQRALDGFRARITQVEETAERNDS